MEFDSNAVFAGDCVFAVTGVDGILHWWADRARAYASRYRATGQGDRV